MMKFIAHLVCYCIYPFSFLFPRSKRKWAFGSFRGAFNDNAKYLFIYVSQQIPEVDSVWISINKSIVKEIQEKGLKAYFVLSPKGIWHALTSKYWFFNAYSSDIMFCLSGNSTRVNLWHGLPMKRIEFDIIRGPLADRYLKRTMKERYYHPETFQRPDYVLSPTPFFSESFAHAFSISNNHCLEFGYPRNEILTCDDAKRQDFIARYESKSTVQLLSRLHTVGYYKVFIYMPTWRDSQREIFVQGFDLDKIDDILRRQKSLLLLKPHANTYVDKSAFERYKNVILLDAGMDVYPILPYTDVLITDYSSVLYDYILMEHHDVILYLYDYENYVKERDFYYPYNENVVGKKAMDFEELCHCIEHEDYHIDEVQRKRILEKFWGDTISYSPCQKISSFFLPTINEHYPLLNN